MKRPIAFAFVLAALAPAIAAQTSDSFTGRWEGTLKMQRPDGTDADPRPAEFNLTQNGKELTGTAGPPEQQRKIEKGTVTDGKATFEVQPPDGPLYKFTLSIVKGRLQGEMTAERDGVVRSAKIDAAKAKDATKEKQPRASAASEPRDRSEPAKRRTRARVGEFEGRSPSEK